MFKITFSPNMCVQQSRPKQVSGFPVSVGCSLGWVRVRHRGGCPLSPGSVTTGLFGLGSKGSTICTRAISNTRKDKQGLLSCSSASLPAAARLVSGEGCCLQKRRGVTSGANPNHQQNRLVIKISSSSCLSKQRFCRHSFIDLSMPPFVPTKQHHDKARNPTSKQQTPNATQRKHHHHTNQSRSQPSISDQSLPLPALSRPTERITETHHSRRTLTPRQTNQIKAVIRNGRFAHHISRHLRISCAVQPSKAGVLCVAVLQSGGRGLKADLSVSSGLLSQRACYLKAERESCRVGFVMHQMRLDVRTSRVGWALGMGTEVLRGVEFGSSKGACEC
ncbi:hypothetical protein QBC34DRAFT_55912 [Podospora aff. communis PSN243]|uniref:Uncharacterized protein n=1 Tax=Podospora aff. communis PSN243 TaxID=3040156 RepID=A0AAV9GTZ4_9PEZI|nr:hypothetical protein QBC34DRAFT_55912 [Podospora aff. communis PSN243]